MRKLTPLSCLLDKCTASSQLAYLSLKTETGGSSLALSEGNTIYLSTAPKLINLHVIYLVCFFSYSHFRSLLAVRRVANCAVKYWELKDTFCIELIRDIFSRWKYCHYIDFVVLGSGTKSLHWEKHVLKPGLKQLLQPTAQREACGDKPYLGCRGWLELCNG